MAGQTTRMRAAVLIASLLAATTAQDQSQTASNALTDFQNGNNENANNNPFASEVEKCVPCEGNQIDVSKSFDGLSCSEWLTFAGQVPANTEECALERLLGWKFCGCPAQTEEMCTFCDNENTDTSGVSTALQLELQLPFSSITCDAFVDVPAIDGETTCNLARDFSYFCGCPTVQPQCTLCADGLPPQNLEAPLYLGMTCSDIQDLYLVSSESRCGNLESDYPFDLQAYCGCNDAPKPTPTVGCDFCPYGGVLNNVTQTLVSDKTSTCGDWATLAEYAKEGESSCAVFQYVGLECCDGMVLPEFFSDYMEEEQPEAENGVDGATVQQEEQEQPQQEQEQPQEEGGGNQQDATTEPVESAIDPNDIAIPFVEEIPNIPSTLSGAVHKCFEQHTVLAGSSFVPSQAQTVAQNNESVVEQAQEELGDLFDTRAGATTNSETTTEGNTTVLTEKFAKLIDDLHQVAAVPDGFNKLVPNEEFANHAFLPSLSGCLVSGIESFQSCLLCDSGAPPTNPRKMIPIVGLYCDEYDAWRAEATGEDCKSISSWLPFDMESFCGCPGVPDPPVVVPATTNLQFENTEAADKQCNFCPQGMVLVLESWKQKVNDPSLLVGYEEDSNCAQWSEMANYATSTDSCSLLQKIAAAGCCESIGGSILDDTPAPFPVSSNTTVVGPSAATAEAVSASGATTATAAALWSMGLSLFALLFV